MALSATDRLDILDLYSRAAHHLDCAEPDRYVALFTVDGVLSRHSGDTLLFRGEGSAQLLAFAQQLVALNGRGAQRWNGNIMIEPTADGASGSCHTLLVTTAAGMPPQLVLAGQFLDRFVRTATGWRFRERRIVEFG